LDREGSLGVHLDVGVLRISSHRPEVESEITPVTIDSFFVPFVSSWLALLTERNEWRD
jgi:hypothetical protein